MGRANPAKRGLIPRAREGISKHPSAIPIPSLFPANRTPVPYSHSIVPGGLELMS